MWKQICTLSDTGYSLKVYRFASAPFNMHIGCKVWFTIHIDFLLDCQLTKIQFSVFHYKISDNRAIIKLETVTSFEWTAFFSGHRS